MERAIEATPGTLTDDQLLVEIVEAHRVYQGVCEWRGRLLMELGARLRMYGVRTLTCSRGEAVLETEAYYYALTQAQAEQLKSGADINYVLNAARTAPRQWIRVKERKEE
ncbi:MAG: hypothetical protein WD208_01120 [Dehalococcoidia bacterium]